MELGTSSISLAVEDLAISRAFYEALGFAVIDGDDESWVMMANGPSKVGLFQGMFDANIITFHPPDARAIEAAVVEAGHPLVSSTEGETGPTNFMVRDPDGNMILFDQH